MSVITSDESEMPPLTSAAPEPSNHSPPRPPAQTTLHANPAWSQPPTPTPMLPPEPRSELTAVEEEGLGAEEDSESLSEEKLRLIKARTMYQTVEVIPSSAGFRRLIFLTNAQASDIAGSDESVRKLLDALELGEPKLVINLIESQGFSEYVDARESWEGGMDGEDVGMVRGAGSAFGVTSKAEREALDRLDAFMADTLIPLAVKTNAVVIAAGTPQSCALARSLLRMTGLMRGKWGPELPFSIINLEVEGTSFYRNLDPNAEWRQVRKASRAWRQRDARLVELMNNVHLAGGGGSQRWDLDPNGMCHVIVDGVDEVHQVTGHRAPGNALKMAIVRQLASTVPSITFKTGNTDKTSLAATLSGTSSLGVCLQAMHSGSPLVFLDVYRRQDIRGTVETVAMASAGEGSSEMKKGVSPEYARRDAIIAEAKRVFSASADELLANGRMAWLDACTIAFFSEALNGDGDLRTEDIRVGSDNVGGRRRLIPLWQALQHAKARQAWGRVYTPDDDNDVKSLSHGGVGGSSNEAYVPRATLDQIKETATFIAERYFRDAHSLLPADRRVSADWAEQFAEEIDCMTVQIRSLLLDDHFYDVNLAYPAAADRLVNSLVKLDRLPKTESLEALCLLRRAWSEYDVCVYLSGKFKLLGKFLFVLELLVGLTIVNVSVVRINVAESEQAKTSFAMVIFVLSMVASLIIAVSTYLNSKPRWRQLRASAGALESVIWQFRARAGPFSGVQGGVSGAKSSAERVMSAALSAWMEQLVSGANLNSTALERWYPPRVYKHHQLDPHGGRGGGGLQSDDHHSPVTPDMYIELRLERATAFYRRRIPAYSRRQTIYKFGLLLLTAAATKIVALGYADYVVVVTAAASTLTSWSEFSDVSSKVQRYNAAVQQIKLLLTWWETLSDVEKSGAENIDRLITRGEAIIGDERLAWQAATAGVGKTVGGGGGKHKGGDSGDDAERGVGGKGGGRKNRVSPQPRKEE